MEFTTEIISKKKSRYFISYGICLIALGLASAILGPMLPHLAENLGVDMGKISFLFTASSLGYLMGSSGGGRLFDRYKGHILMLIALLLMILMGIGIPLAPVYFLLLVIIFLFGIGQGLVDVGANINLLWVYQSRVGPYMNGMHFFFGLGAFLSPIIVHKALGMSNGQITWAFWVIAILFLPSLIGLSLLPSPINPELEKQHENQGSRDIWLVVLMMLSFFLYVGAELGFGGWIYSYVTELEIGNEANAAYINSIYWGALTLGRFLTVLLSKKIQPSKILFGNFILSILSLAVLLLWPVELIVVWLCSALLGLGFSSVFPTLLVLSESRMKITGRVTGLFFLGSSVGGMLIPMILGQIFEYIGAYQVILALFFIVLFGLMALLAVIFASNRVGEKAR